MENNVPYIVHEGAMARLDRTIKRLWVVIILLIFLLVCSNGFWIYYESQFEPVEETTEVTQDADDGSSNSFIGGNSDGGEAKDKD